MFLTPSTQDSTGKGGNDIGQIVPLFTTEPD